MANGTCKIADCPWPVTHKVVFNPVGEPRVTEYYCEEHAGVAADMVKDAEYGDLFLGPVELEE